MQLRDYSLFSNVYNGKKVLVTGNTGFKGSWLSMWLLMMGAKVYGLSDGVPTSPSHFHVANIEERITYIEKDIRSLSDVKKIISEIKPDFVFHLAAQPLVRLSYNNPVLTIETNVIGTMNVLEALRLLNHRCYAVMITSDKCYDNVEWTWGYRESDSLGGKDPYSASKGAAELVIKTYANSYFATIESNVKIASVRAGNVIGGGDWAQDRIVPDCIRAWSGDEKVQIRNPMATRPWQHVLEPLSGYLLMGQKLFENPSFNGEPFNFGPNADQNFTVAELISEMQKHWPGSDFEITDNSGSKKEATLLKLCCDKAFHNLGWKPTLNYRETVKFTVDWYWKYYSLNKNVFNITLKQIEDYIQLASERGQVWVSLND